MAAYNRSKDALNDPKRRSRKLVIRGFSFEQEYQALMYLCRHPPPLPFGEEAIGRSRWSRDIKWKRNLSLAQWTLALWGGNTIGQRQIHEQDKRSLYLEHTRIMRLVDTPSANFRDLVRGNIDWAEYEAKDDNQRLSKEDILKSFEWLVTEADILCTTPALSENVKLYSHFKTSRAQGMVIDEAAALNRPDLYCVWGNW